MLFETGYGPSGLPHIGTFGEVARTTMIRRAFEVISKSVTPSVLRIISDAITATRVEITEEEALAAWPKIQQWAKVNGRKPNVRSDEPTEKRYAEVLLFLFGLDLLRHRPRESGRAHFPYLFTALTVIFDSLVSLARIVNAVLHPTGGADFLAPTPLNALYFATHGLLAICISVGFILMLNERLHALLEHQLSHDPLTNAYSRPMIFELAQRELGNLRQPLSLLLLDIDHFKQANDSLGHQGGDEVLKHFVRTLSANLRSNEPLGRYGGEEFIILLRDVDADSARITAERLRQCVAEAPYRHSQGDYPITTSIGHATAHSQESLEQLLQRADTALYRAKREGRNRVEQA